MNEHEKFLKELDTDRNTTIDILEQPFVQPTEQVVEVAKEDDNEGDEFKPKNRRERRLMEKLQSERESSIFLAGKLEARSEAQKSVTEESDYLKGIERIYGTESPEAQLATDLLKKAFEGVRTDAENRAYERLQAEREREVAEVKNAESELDGFIEEIEDTYDIELTPTQEKSYFQLLQKMSPKDTEGNVVNYADPHAVWEVFQERLEKRGTDGRAKALSSRSMVQSGASNESTLQDDSSARFLKENGII